jgi:phosphoglycolate phosphatase
MAVLSFPAVAPKIAFFDWDGTLCDSRESIYAINLYMAEQYGKAENLPSYEDWLQDSHPGVEDCMRFLGVQEDSLHIKQFFNRLLVEQREQGLRNPLYPGVYELLSWLKKQGIPMILISRHLHEHLLLDVEAHGLTHFFDHIIGEPKGEKLSKEVEIRRLCFSDQYSVVRAHTFYLGDTVHDMVPAKQAGVVSIAVTHGYEPRHRLEEVAPGFIFDSLDEVLELLKASA